MKINVNIQMVYQEAVVLKQKAESYDRIIKTMSARMHEMQNIWIGEDNQAFIQKFDELVPQLNKMTQVIEEASNYLQKSANAYQTLQEDRVAKAKFLG